MVGCLLQVWDQNAFNDLFRRGVRRIDGDPNNYFMGDNDKLKMGILPVALFASGHTYFVQARCCNVSMSYVQAKVYLL